MKNKYPTDFLIRYIHVYILFLGSAMTVLNKDNMVPMLRKVKIPGANFYVHLLHHQKV